jgi:hypothetical protein
MIQFKRGSTESWSKQKAPLADGQPGYDKDRKKLKIGNGKDSWNELPDVGIAREDILISEKEAKKKQSSAASILLHKLGIDDSPIITYGPEVPNKNTVGSIYLQHYEAEPEVDYIVDAGIDNGGNGWTYQKWRSGIARCWITLDFKTAIQTALGGSSLYQNSTEFKKIPYPFVFKEQPSETAAIQSKGGLVWLGAAKKQNTESQSAVYVVISPDKLDSATYTVSLQVEGFWK